ncbi:ABC transporter, substrate binding protein (sugar) [Agrobacterium sp. ATCC 31749]|nr:ABC transporter, substrate binding protein (sugar) [Agrobacterium sp. ATCC 31749]
MGHLKIGGPGHTRRNHDTGQKGRRNNTHSHESPPSLKRCSRNLCEDF